MKIKMLQSIPGSLDGVTVVDLVEGVEYDTVDSARGERLALTHIRRGVAFAVVDAPPAVAASPDLALSKRKPARAK